MSVNLSTYPRNDITTEFNEDLEKVLRLVMDIASIFTLFTSLFIIYLIFYHSPRMMSDYKKYLLADMISVVVSVIFVALSKPKMLYGLYLGFTDGLLPVQKEPWTIFSVLFWYAIMVWGSSCLVLIHVERYYTTHRGIQKDGCFGPKLFVYFYLIMNTAVTLGFCIPAVFGDIYITGKVVETYIKTKITGDDELYEKYPGAVLLNNKSAFWSLIYYVSLLIAACIIFIPLFTFLLLNACTGFKAIRFSNYSKKTKAIHITLLRASILQVLLTLVCGTLPIAFFLIGWITGAQIPGMELMQSILNFNPLVTNLVIILFVKPYRDFIFSYWKRNAVTEFSRSTSFQGNKGSTVSNITRSQK